MPRSDPDPLDHLTRVVGSAALRVTKLTPRKGRRQAPNWEFDPEHKDGHHGKLHDDTFLLCLALFGQASPLAFGSGTRHAPRTKATTKGTPPCGNVTIRGCFASFKRSCVKRTIQEANGVHPKR